MYWNYTEMLNSSHKTGHIRSPASSVPAACHSCDTLDDPWLAIQVVDLTLVAYKEPVQVVVDVTAV